MLAARRSVYKELLRGGEASTAQRSFAECCCLLTVWSQPWFLGSNPPHHFLAV